MGAWIETLTDAQQAAINRRTRMGAWIETSIAEATANLATRRTRMGAWIETVVPQLETLTIKVAPVWVRGLKRI